MAPSLGAGPAAPASCPCSGAQGLTVDRCAGEPLVILVRARSDVRKMFGFSLDSEQSGGTFTMHVRHT
jgi:hypothetical protein